jgi:drug/metabolite transporter (DMT)-like permease
VQVRVRSITSIPRKSRSFSGACFILAAAAGFSCQGIFTTFAYRTGANASTVGLGRFTVAAALLVGYAALRNRRGGDPVSLPWRTALVLLGLGSVGYFLASLTYLLAISYASVPLVTLLAYTYPALATSIAIGLGRERLTARLGQGFAVTVLGVGIILSGPVVAGSLHGNWRGLAFGLCNALLYALYIVVSERIVQRIHAVVAMTYIAVGAAVSYGLMTVATGSEERMLHVGSWGWIAGIALASTVVAAGAFLAGLRRLGTARTVTLSMVEIPFTALLAALLLGQRLTLLQVAGGITILSGVFILVRERASDGGHRPLSEALADGTPI